MDKEEFVSVLGRKGYVAKNESSVVIVYAHNIQNEKEKNTFLSQIKAVVQECETQKQRKSIAGNAFYDVPFRIERQV